MVCPSEVGCRGDEDETGQAGKSDAEYPHEAGADEEAGKVRRERGVKWEVFQDAGRARAEQHVQDVHGGIDIHVEEGGEHDEWEGGVVYGHVEGEEGEGVELGGGAMVVLGVVCE